jgi:hypothetical protein
VRTLDGLERKIGIFREEWLGDRYSDPIFLCEASSIDRLIKWLSNAVNDIEISDIRGSMLIPPGTYIYEFDRETWSTETEIFQTVIKATQEAFKLEISIEQHNGENILIVKREQNKPVQQTGRGGRP